MKIIELSYGNDINIPESINLCLGYFDALHIGHLKMIKDALSNGKKTALMTFDVSPSFILGKTDKKDGISSLSDKADFLEEFGLDYLIILEFNTELSEVSHEDFVSDILKKMNIDTIYCGQDYRFGFCALGDVSYLKEHFNVKVMELLKVEDKKVSSRDIIKYIETGKISKANELLGRNYRVCGNVEKGLGNGNKLGFATANLDLDFSYVMPKEGVYMGYVFVDDVKYKCVISVSTHPSIQTLAKPIIEVHILDFSDNLYGKFLYVEFYDYIRDIKVFENTEKLVDRINKDVELAKKQLKL